MSEYIITYALSNWITYAVLATAGGLGVLFRKKFKSQKNLHNGVQAILRNEIITIYNEHQRKGYCPIYVKDNVKSLAKPYHDLDGNGVVDKLVDELLLMPTEKNGDV